MEGLGAVSLGAECESASVREIELNAISIDDGLSLERQRGRHAGDLKRSSFSKKLSSLKWNGVARNERPMDRCSRHENQ